LVIAIKLSTSASFRSISKIVALLNIYLDLNLKVPSHVSILLWTKKIGVYKLSQPREKTDDWILIIDESVEFGHNRLLVLLGIREGQIDFTRPLQYQDVTCLKTISSNSWKGEDIKEVIEGLIPQLGKIKYVVADTGNSIQRALKLSGIVHVKDITHQLSLIIKDIYQDDELFIAYNKTLAHMRGSLALSNVSHILPPQQRVNSRFMNLKPVFEWGKSALKSLDSGDLELFEKEKLLFLKEYKELILETTELLEKANKIQEILKSEGLSIDSKTKCMNIFQHREQERIEKLKTMLELYMNEMLDNMKGTPKILCASDIIESSFGKYKNYISNNKSIGITDLSLAISAFTGKLDRKELIKAIGQVKVQGVKDWGSINIGLTQSKKRQMALKMGGRKLIPTP
jgi:hypothetical protein